MTAVTAQCASSNINTQSSTTQQKAIVFEHSCLFTHDVRRKNSKRWQDGHLRFHAFNSRVMVYDQSQNYIGDTNYQEAGSEGLEDGEEFMLERGGILVQVGERLARKETNLTDLLAKRAPKPLEKSSTPNARERTGMQNCRSSPYIQLQPGSLTRTPQSQRRWMGWQGFKTQPPLQSPYETRQEADDTVTGGGQLNEIRPTKRRCYEQDEHVPLWQVLRTTRPTSSRKPLSTVVANGESPRRPQPRPKSKEKSVKKLKPPASQPRLKVQEWVDITSSSEAPGQISRPDEQISRLDERGLQGVNSPSARDTLQQRTVVHSEKCEDVGVAKHNLEQRDTAMAASDPIVIEDEDEPDQTQKEEQVTKSSSYRESLGPQKKQREQSTKQTLADTSPTRAQSSPLVNTTSHMLPQDRQEPSSPLATSESVLEEPNSLAEPATKSLRLPSVAPKRLLHCQRIAASKVGYAAVAGRTETLEDTIQRRGKQRKQRPVENVSENNNATAATSVSDSPYKGSTTSSPKKYGTSSLDEQFFSLVTPGPASRIDANRHELETTGQTLPKEQFQRVREDYTQPPLQSSINIISNEEDRLHSASITEKPEKSHVTSNSKNPISKQNKHLKRKSKDKSKQPNAEIQNEPDEKDEHPSNDDKDDDTGPWSREAFDLFGWCPEPLKQKKAWWGRYNVEVEV